jgi:hypothetical protein
MAAFCLALSLATAPLLAQTAPEEKPQTSESSSQSADTSAGTKPVPASSGSTKKTPAPTTGSDSPFDYRSSEKISEDVPVSFPVDI